MLSILIPTYNYNIVPLVEKLHSQALSLLIDFEIIVAEDGSQHFTSENCEIEKLSCVQHPVLKENIGRAAVRNLLADKAQYPTLLFIDCDAEVCCGNFISRYLPFCSEQCVVIGGTAYSRNKNSACSLRLKYGKKREARLASERGKNTFTTFNFLISKSIFTSIKFDESIRGYGYEDMVFGHQLKLAGYSIMQIDNTLIHRGLDINSVYLQKTAEGLDNLLKLYNSGKYPFLPSESKILYQYLQTKRFKADKIISLAFLILKKSVIQNLTGTYPSLFLFDFYKLAYLCSKV